MSVEAASALRASVLRASVLATASELGSHAAAWDVVLATVASAHGQPPQVAPPATPTLAPWREPGAIEQLGTVYEGLIEARQASGTFYTPPDLVSWVLDRVLDGVLDPAIGPPEHPSVLDPACGAGHFLIAWARRLIERGVQPTVAVGLVHGVDLDPVAVQIARLRLMVLAPGVDPDVRVGDGLGGHPGAPYDAVVGNPPFLGQLRTRTAATPAARAERAGRAGRAARLGAYTDTSAVFLEHCLGLVRSGGCVALVQPLSLLAARDASPVRDTVVAVGAITAFWSSLEPVFPGTAVLTCVPVVTVGAGRSAIPTWFGPGFEPAADQPMPAREWGPLVAPAAGIPAVSPRTSGTIGDLARCTADFRDQYYGLIPFIREAATVGEAPGGGTPGGGAPVSYARLVTSGLIDPAQCRWGEVSTRFAKTRYVAPVVDLEALASDPGLSAWARTRLVPKLLVATQGRVIEAVVDLSGAWVPSVPVLSVAAPPEHLWHLLAVLLAPPVVAAAAARYLGTALAPGAIKLSARQLAALPLPSDQSAWDRGADLARAAQVGAASDRRERLLACAETMCAAYADDAALGWWSGRLPTP